MADLALIHRLQQAGGGRPTYVARDSLVVAGPDAGEHVRVRNLCDGTMLVTIGAKPAVRIVGDRSDIGALLGQIIEAMGEAS